MHSVCRGAAGNSTGSGSISMMTVASAEGLCAAVQPRTLGLQGGDTHCTMYVKAGVDFIKSWPKSFVLDLVEGHTSSWLKLR